MDSRPSNPELNFDDTFQLDDTDWQGLVDLDNEAHIHRSGDGSSGLSDHLPAGPGGASFPMSYTFSGASSYEDVPTYSWSMPPPLTNASSFQTSNQASYHSANLLEDESVFPGYFNVNSAPGSFDNNELVLPSRPKTPEFTPAERHAESTPISIPRATQTKQRRRRTSFGASSASAQKWIQYKPDEGKTGRLVTFSANSHGVVRKNRGRTGGLSPIARKEAAAMRIIGACDSCRRRKEKCDPGTPCKSCVEHFKCDLLLQPCRGSFLEDIAGVLLSNQLTWHPSHRSLDQFLGPGTYVVAPNVYILPLSLGFGPSMYLPMKVVWPLELDKLIHRHIVYPWPPIPGSTSANGTELYHAVLPVVLASTDGAQWQLDAHLTLLVNEHFQSFPLYQSPLKVLSNIYHFYVQIGRPVILLVALKFLVLTHMADGAVIPVSDQNVRSIIRGTLHSVDSSLAACPTPCFVRGQLGAEVPVLASKLLRNLLTRLERIALSRQCNQWPVVLASMAVLLMAMESIHYKAAKEEYHAHMKDRKNIDPMPAMRRNFSTTSNISTSSTSSSSFSTTGLSTPHSSVVDINDGAINAILRFYRNCFGGCHEKLALPAQPVHPAPLVPTISSFHSLRPTHHQHTYSFGDLVQGAAHAPAPIALSAASAPQARVDDSATAEASFVSGVRSALADAREYLGERKTEKGTDMTGFFDRLLARLFV